VGHPPLVVLLGNAGSLRRSLRGAEAPLFHGCAGACGGISGQRPSGAEARIFALLNGTTEVVPFPTSNSDRSAEALRHPKARRQAAPYSFTVVILSKHADSPRESACAVEGSLHPTRR
jgi:hypothetical protein